MLLWTLLTFIVWTKSFETFLKISKSNSFLGELSLILVLLCIYWIHHPCLTCSSVSYWGVIPLCTLMNFTISKASGGVSVLRNNVIVHCPISMCQWCPHIARLSCRLLLKSHRKCASHSLLLCLPVCFCYLSLAPSFACGFNIGLAAAPALTHSVTHLLPPPLFSV